MASYQHFVESFALHDFGGGKEKNAYFLGLIYAMLKGYVCL
jgi:hypothetical protein